MARPPPKLVLAGLIALPVAWGLAYWFVCDDAFISFRYVRNLLHGDGLVFNPGEYVEGYTNFLWILELAAIWGLFGLRPELAAPVLGAVWTVVVGVTIVLLARRTPVGGPLARWAAPLALLVWGTNRSVAVWVTSGLETRQFTGLVLLGLYALSRWREGRRWLVIGSTCCALAALTRPEALAIGPMLLLWALGEHLRARCANLRSALAAALPFVLLVGAHLLWRHAYYGEWLPNTYYAKNVRPWWDAGGMFLGLAAIEHALYLVLPLALWGTRARWRAGDGLHLALWMWAIPVYLHAARIGGDHFEFRMLDELWPPLALAASDGLLALAGASSRRLVAGAALTVVFGLAIPLSHDRLAFQRKSRAEAFRMKIPVTLETSPWLVALPPIPFLLPTYERWTTWLADHVVAIRHREHQLFARQLRHVHEPLEGLSYSGLFQAPVIAARNSTGVFSYYQPQLVVIDTYGLTDATVARNPVTTPNEQRKLGHDRKPPPGYLAQRGVNFELRGIRRTMRDALQAGPYAVELAPNIWMAFASPRPSDLPAIFGERRVHNATALLPARK